MTEPRILARRRQLSLAAAPTHPLSSIQLQQEAILRNFVSQASDPITLGSIVAGGAVGRGIQNFGYSQLFPLARDSKVLQAFVKTSTSGTALTAEAGIFVLSDKSARVAWQDAHPSTLYWEGSSGIKNAWMSAWVNFGAFRAISPFTQGQNIALRNFLNSTAIVSANQVTGHVGLTPLPQENLISQFAHASAMDLQLQAGMQMLHATIPAFALPSTFHHKLWDRTPIDLSAKFFSKASLPLESLAFSASRLGTLDRLALGLIQAKQTGNAPDGWTWLRFKTSFLLLSKAGKRELALECSSRLEKVDLSDKDAEFILKAFTLTLTELGIEQTREIIAKAQQAYENSTDPSYRVRWVYVLDALLPRLEGTQRLEVVHFLLEAALNPYSNIADLAEKGLLNVFEKLDREELMNVGNHLARLDYQEQRAGKRFRSILAALSMGIHFQSEHSSLAQKIEMLDWFAQFIAHRDFNLATHAAQNWIELLKDLPPTEVFRLIEKHKNNFTENLTGHLHWLEFSLGQLKQTNLSETEIKWHHQRAELSFLALQNRLRTLQLPPRWQDLSRQAQNFKSSAEIEVWRKDFQAQLRSQNPTTQHEVEMWWKQLPAEERWTSLELLMGPKNFLVVNGKEALRWRRLASLGLPHEVGFASEKTRFSEDDPVVMTLGADSVMLPEAYVDLVGIEKAQNYLFIHHTHPQRPHQDNLHQIYPSTFSEGGGGGDLHALYYRFEKMTEGEQISLSLTHVEGGSIFALRKLKGKAIIDIYTGIQQRGSRHIKELSLSNVRRNIRTWAAKNGIELHFFEVDYAQIETMDLSTGKLKREILD